jgi:O-antigen ligase
LAAGARTGVTGNGAAGPVAFWITAAILVWAPLFRGGNRPLPLLVLECLALAGVATLVASRPLREAFSVKAPLLRWALAILVAVPVLQLVPLPYALWSALPGHGPYAAALEGAGVATGWRPLSMHARATEFSWLALLPCVAIFLLVSQLGRRQLRTLVMVFVAVALAEAVLGILQTGAGRDSALQLGNKFAGSGATGTYVNRNHFGGLMAMALPVLVAAWASATLPARDSSGEILRAHPRHADARLARRLAWSLAVALALAALLFSRSRAAIGFGLLAFGATSLALVWSAATHRVRAALGVVAVVAFLLAAYAGLTPIVERFSPDDLSLGYAGRLELAGAALAAGFDFLPFGSGLGTFGDVFQRYQHEGLVGYVDHAHNDYAEAFVELGVAGLAVIVLMAGAVLARWGAIARGMVSRSLGTLQIAAGFSVLALALHGIFDFNFHIPANAVYFAFLAGVFFYEPRQA